MKSENANEIEGYGILFNTESIRKAFIRKVYSLIALQIGITFGIVCAFNTSDPLKIWFVQHHLEIVVLSSVISLGVLVLLCFENIKRSPTGGMICLLIFTVAESLLLTFGTLHYKTDIILMALGMTAIAVVGLTLFAFQTKWDFTACGGVLCAMLVVFMIFAIIMIFIPYNKTLHIVYAAIGTLLFSAYLIYDTQMLMGGNHKSSISPEDYILAAISIYLDIIMLYEYILQLLDLSSD